MERTNIPEGSPSSDQEGVNLETEIATESKEDSLIPGSAESSSSEEGDTRSLSEEDEELDEAGDGGIEQDTTEITEPSSFESFSPKPGGKAEEKDIGAEEVPASSEADDDDDDDVVSAEEPAEAEVPTSSEAPTSPEADDVTSGSSSYGTPPKFYRLNASIRESDEDLADKGNGMAQARQDIDFSLDTVGRNDITSVDPQTVLTKDGPETAMNNKSHLQQDGVRFVNVCIREYEITIGDNPYCSHGVPICLDWNHGEDEIIPIDFYEASHKRRRNTRRMLLNSFQRRDMLWRSGYRLEDIEQAVKENDREKFRRSLTLYFLPLYHLQEALYFATEKCFKSKKTDAQQIVEAVQKQQIAELENYKKTADMEVGEMSLVHQYGEEHDIPRRRLSFRSSGSRSGGGSNSSIGNHYNRDWSIRSGSVCSDLSHDRDDPYAASSNSRFREYSVRVDRGQHDKATEIILCNSQRPHMRAFHSAWFSFFIAFFMWFAITPLLTEVRDTLGLSDDEIWYSSLCGTAGTIIMRILIGPACDKFGARLCMAFVLAAAAIPCALTGLVETAQGLSIVRAFIGIAGSSFVACQYWTSQMFTREVAGTANALVAGWGNLGGGVTQLVMGSALFPLFRLIFGYEDGDDPEDNTTSSELAWRTVFVVPAVMSLLTAAIIVYHADDSPKGDYRERVRQQEIMVVSPTASLCAACQNWNVWILLIQYACCFGVEVTMTNATALYFKDEFGQTTVSAAAIASVFGFMNLFARGLGGFGGDLLNAMYGMRGRMIWQTVTLFLEGVAVVIFGFADTLAGSIFALIFLSLMVQSAEGSVFGIVPYVDRRFTGAVVGWVGAGGNVGGVCFSLLFIHFQYKKAFAFMGVAAAASAFLSCFLNCKKLTRNAETLGNEGKSEEEFHHHHHHNEAIGITRNTAITFAQLEQQES